MGAIIKNQSFLNVVQGGAGTASTKVNPGDIVNRIVLYGTGTALTMKNVVARVRCLINEKIVYNLTGAQIASINAFRGLTEEAGFLTIDFVEPMASTPGSQYIGGIDTSRGVNSFDIEVELTATPADFKLSAYLDVSPSTGEKGLDFLTAFVPVTKGFTAGGMYTIQPGQFGNNHPHRLKRLHVFDAGGVVSSVGVRKDSIYIFQNVPKAVNEHILKEMGRVPQAGHYCYDPVMYGNFEENLYFGNARTLEYEIETTGAGNVVIVSEMVTKLPWI